jgi:hypothetical protein
MLSRLAVSICGLVTCHSTRIVLRNDDGTAVRFLFRRCGLVPKRTFAHIYGNRRFVSLPCSQNHVQNQCVLVHVFRPVSLICVFISHAIKTWDIQIVASSQDFRPIFAYISYIPLIFFYLTMMLIFTEEHMM